MGDSIREYLERQSTQVLKNICKVFSIEPYKSEYEYYAVIIKEILKEREK